MLLYFFKKLIPFRPIGFQNEYASDNIFLNRENELPNFLRTYFQLVKNQLIVMFLILFFSIVIVTKYLSIEKEKSNVLDIIFLKFLINFVGLLISLFLLSFLYAPEITTDEIYFFYMFCTFFIFYVFSLQTIRMKLDMYSDPFVGDDESNDESFRIFIFSIVLICIFFLILYLKRLQIHPPALTQEFKNELLKGNNIVFLVIFTIVVFLLVYMFLNALKTNLKDNKLLSSLSTLVFLCCLPIVLFLVFHIHKPLQGINLSRMKKGMNYSFFYEYFIILAMIQIIFYNIPKDFLLLLNSQNSEKKETD